MKIKFYLLPLLLFLFVRTAAQDCSSLLFSYSTAESRCVATGSITVTASGGSGNYNYKAIGPVTTPVTSSNIITGLAPGYYSVLVQDLATGCSRQTDSIYVSGSYSDPRFQLTKTDGSCAGNDGTISVVNQQFGRSPFTYTIIAPSPSHVGTSNTTGIFTGLTSGEYVVQLQDSCGGIQVRRITIENYSWWFDSVSVVRVGCDMANVFIRLKDNKGNVNTIGTAFSGFTYGYLDGADTTWFGTHNFSVFLGSKKSLVLVVKDNCGTVHTTNWSLPNNLKPSLGSANLSNLTCSGFTATVSGTNLTSPAYCIYDNSGALIGCNTTGSFTDLAYGNYCIEVFDACYDTTITRCFTANRPTPSVAASVNISNRNCDGFTATITGQSNLTSPQFCLFDVNDVQISCNATGVFTDVPYGSYCIKVHDGCTDTTISRCFTVTQPPPTLTGFTYSGSGCTSFGVQVSGNNLNNPQYCLFDSLGNVVTCNTTGNFGNLPYANYCVRAISCGDTTNSVCFSGSRPVPSVAASVQITNRQCSTFTATITGQTNLTTPLFCLYDSNDSLITCDSTGVFANIPYGSYCIKITNSCFDTVITRCFTQLQTKPSVNSTLQLLSSNCTTVSFKVNGSNLTSPNYCLYNASDSLLACNTTGTFNNYPYGQYCVKVEDGCVDTIMQVCRTFAPVRGITLVTSKSCTMNTSFIDVQFANGNAPYTIDIYHPDGSLVSTNTTSSNPYSILVPALPAGAQYKVVGTDNCGNRDSATIIPDANIVTKNTTAKGKCPSSLWLNGSGDILSSCTSNYHAVTPQIIKKNGAVFNKSYSSVSAGIYTFADLEPAQYIVQYTQSTCNGKLYDTVTVAPYAYPSQGQSAVYQCDNNGFSLSSDVQGGVSPYSFQIIGSLPAAPSIATTPQSSAVFSINNGTIYSLIRLRTIDACGNATLSDVSVLPLQNISVRVTDSCFYRSITLSVDTIPNATYSWYRKTTPTDSTLLGSDLAFYLPFFVPEEIGQYICKVNVNDGCITRLSSFNLTGNCFGTVLPVSIQLQGRKIRNTNQLFWDHLADKGVIKYSVERKQANEPGFSQIGIVPAQKENHYFFNDDDFSAGTTQYRLRIIYLNKSEYSNIIVMRSGFNEIGVYPNPVKDVFQVSLEAQRATDYMIELVGSNGQLYHRSEIKNVRSTILSYPRDSKIKPGMYLLRVTDKTTGTIEVRKLVFE